MGTWGCKPCCWVFVSLGSEVGIEEFTRFVKLDADEFSMVVNLEFEYDLVCMHVYIVQD